MITDLDQRTGIRAIVNVPSASREITTGEKDEGFLGRDERGEEILIPLTAEAKKDPMVALALECLMRVGIIDSLEEVDDSWIVSRGKGQLDSSIYILPWGKAQYQQYTSGQDSSFLHCLFITDEKGIYSVTLTRSDTLTGRSLGLYGSRHLGDDRDPQELEVVSTDGLGYIDHGSVIARSGKVVNVNAYEEGEDLINAQIESSWEEPNWPQEDVDKINDALGYLAALLGLGPGEMPNRDEWDLPALAKVLRDKNRPLDAKLITAAKKQTPASTE